MEDSDTKTNVIGLLSSAYNSLIESVKEHRSQLDRGSALFHSKDLDDNVKDIISVLDVESTERDKTEQVVKLLDHYSSTIVKLIELKLNKQP